MEIPLDKEKQLVLVCVTMQHSCDRLIREGRRLADEIAGEIAVVHVTHPDGLLLGCADEAQAMDELFTAANEAGAQLQVVRSAHVAESLAEFAAECGATDLVMGQSSGKKRAALSSILEEIGKRIPDVRVHMIPESGNFSR